MNLGVIVSLFLLIGVAEAAPDQCGVGTFRSAFAGKRIEEPVSYCGDLSRGTFRAKACAEKKCRALEQNLCGLKLEFSPMGSPGSRLCEKAGGVFQIGSIFDGKVWRDTDRCLFPEDKSFADSGSLVARYAACFEQTPKP